MERTTIRPTVEKGVVSNSKQQFAVRPLLRLGLVLFVPVIATGVALLVERHLAPNTVVLIYILGVALAATRFDMRETIVVAVASVAAFDYVFVTPRWAFSLQELQYWPTFIVMFAVALLVSSLSLRLRNEADAAQRRGRRMVALYQLTRELVIARGQNEIAELVTARIREEVGLDAAVLLPNAHDQVEPAAVSKSSFEFEPTELAAAQAAYAQGCITGIGSTDDACVRGLYFPLQGTKEIVGVLGTLQTDRGGDTGAAQRELLEAFANTAALALERTRLAQETQAARLQVESERMRNSLLGSVSHDLRTPLTVISGVAGALMQEQDPSTEMRKELAGTIFQEAERLNRHVRDLLDMTRLEAGLRLNIEWQSVEELIGASFSRVESLMQDRPVRVEIEPDLPLVKLDEVLIDKVLVNLLENAAKHTPPGTEVELCAQHHRRSVVIEVSDRGNGLPPGGVERLFEKFYRPAGARPDTGFGMGLAICRTIMKLHGGTIIAFSREGGGATFRLTFPLTETPPEVPIE